MPGEPLAIAARQVPAPRPEPAPHQLTWLDDLGAARRAARLTGRPLLIYAHAAWDVASRAAAREIWRDERVIAATEGFVTLALDASDPDDVALEQELAALRIDRIPTVVALSPSGAEQWRLEGAMTTESLLERLGR